MNCNHRRSNYVNNHRRSDVVNHHRKSSSKIIEGQIMAFIENEETKTKQKYCLMYKRSKRKENVKYMGWRRLHRRVITMLHGRLLHGPTADGRETVFPAKHVFLHRVGLGLLRVLQLYVWFAQADF